MNKIESGQCDAFFAELGIDKERSYVNNIRARYVFGIIDMRDHGNDFFKILKAQFKIETHSLAQAWDMRDDC
jgi:hypothetical protein